MEIGETRRVLTEDEIFDSIREDLRGVEEALALESAASSEAVIPISSHLQNGAEHLRAALLLLCARFAGGAANSRMAIRLGAVVEMLHAATLAHSRVLDREQARPGPTSASVQRLNSSSVLGGDWLYLRAFRAALQEHVFHLVISEAQMMVSAELIQVNHIGSIDLTEVDCLELADRKTACLFSVCGKLGAVAAGADERLGQKLAEFGWNLGMAIELIDNILDLSGSEPERGKPAGRDFKAGKVALPLVYALEQASACERDLVARVLRDRSYKAISFENVLALVDRYGGIERTRARARQFTDHARQILAELPDSRCRLPLLTLTNLITERGC